MSNKKRYSEYNPLQRKISEPARDRMVNKLSSDFIEKSERISKNIREIIELLHKTDPLRLMNFLVITDYYSNLGMTSEIGYTRDQILQNRAIEYIQSLLVSTAYEFLKSEVELDQEEMYFHEIQSKTIKVYGLVEEWYSHWAAYAEKEMKLNRDEIDYIIESQLFSQVRGNRYQVQLEEHLHMLISPLDVLLQKNYDVSAEDVISGLISLEQKLTHGRGEALLEFHELMDNSNFDPNNIEPDIKEKGKKAFDSLFGNETSNVGEITNWSDSFLNQLSLSIGESNQFTHDYYEFWPILSLPIQKKPFIKIDNEYYCFAYYNMFDNVYRIIQKLITEIDGANRDTWEQIQKESSEKSIAELFSMLLPGCDVYRDNYYPEKESLRRMYENDIIITYENSLFIVEVKAGAFSPTTALINYQSHLKSYKSLVEKADQQCQRTLSYISRQKESPIYDKDKQLKTSLLIDEYDYVYTFCVTLDDFNEFAAKAEKLNNINIETGTIVISIEDLRTYKDYFESPFVFLHFLENRKKATQTEALQLTDELDHLGLYIEHNNYPEMANNLKKNSIFQVIGYREPIDEYFMSLWSEEEVTKPERIINPVINQLLTLLEIKENGKKLIFSEFLLDLSQEEADQFSQSISSVQRRQLELNKMVPAISIKKNLRYVIFIEQPNIEKYPFDKMLKYCDGMLAYGEYASIILIYLRISSEGKVKDFHFKKRERDNISDERMDTLIEFGQKTFETKLRSILKTSGKKKIGRNDLCPCGSGLKYKRCCIS